MGWLPPRSEAAAWSRCGARDDGLLAQSIERHDSALAHAGLDIWLGAEPTFTVQESEAPEWLRDALGSDKEARAKALVRALARSHPGAAVMRPVGRQYAGERGPRWCYGLYSRRDGKGVWAGPPDLLEDGSPGARAGVTLSRVLEALRRALERAGWSAAVVRGELDGPQRLVCRADGRPLLALDLADPRLLRPSFHHIDSGAAALVDVLASEGLLLVLLHAGGDAPDENELWVELPAFGEVSICLQFLEEMSKIARAEGVRGLGLRGLPPPVEPHVAWTTITPDPAVLEINQAPEATLHAFAAHTAELYCLARQVGLSPLRMLYNGSVGDSGGGGQLTFGGPTAASSPFFRHPQLLPRLIRYLVAHPSLSYWFATRYVGAYSQAPRPDEGVRDAFLELDLALESLGRLPEPAPAVIGATLQHFLADSTGNPHRSELNIEKLHNPSLPGRGCLGLVELRALAMPSDPRLACARALLFRGVVAMLCGHDKVPRLIQHGDELHDKFALPFFLRKDLQAVLADLNAAALGLGEAVEAWLLERPSSELGGGQCGPYRVQLSEAIEFWPLVGDAASQEGGGSRLVDASTVRLEVLATTDLARAVEGDLTLEVNGYGLPLRAERTRTAGVRVMGIRYRTFVPGRGLHPEVNACPAVTLTLRHVGGAALRLTVHGWKPGGGAYVGLPGDLAEAAARRAERVVVEELSQGLAEEACPAPRSAVTRYCLDVRRLPPAR